MTASLVLLAGLAAAQPGGGVVSGADVKRLAARVLRLDAGDKPPGSPTDLDTLKKLLDGNPALKKAVEDQVKDFQKLTPEKQREKLAELQQTAADPAVRQQLEQALGRPPGDTPPGTGPPPPRATDGKADRRPADPPAPTRPDPPRDAPGSRSQFPPPGEDGQPPATPRTPVPPPAPADRTGYDKFLRFWEQNVGPLKDTPAVQELAKELFRGPGAGGGGAGSLGGLIDPKTAGDLLKGLPEVGDRGGWSLPEVGGLPDRPTFPRAEFAAPEAPSAGAIGVVLGLAAAAAAVVVLLRHLSGRVAAAAPRPVPGLGPWPLDPRGVETRADLVRAFEYLSVLLNGDPARAYSHEAAAAALRAAVPEAADAAGPLADAYALARYTPADRLLGPGELAAARRHLCRLAGVPAA